MGMRTWAPKPASQPISWPHPSPSHVQEILSPGLPLGGNRGAFILHS